jgi:hypothetical protein
MRVGVTKDYKLKVRNLHASHTLENGDHPVSDGEKIVMPVLNQISNYDLKQLV